MRAPVFIACRRRTSASVGRAGWSQLVGLQVEALTADHAGGTGCARETEGQLGAHGGIGVGVRTGQQLERDGQQGVAGQDGGPFVEGLVHGRPAATQIVVVHGRQVVMHERIAMHAFQRRGGRQGGAGLHAEQGGALDQQERTYPLAPAKRGMTHGVEQPRGCAGRRHAVEKLCQTRLDVGPPCAPAVG